MVVEIERSTGLCTYEVPVVKGMKIMDVLDYIYANLDHDLAYYRHSSCCQAICGRCACKVDGKQILACATEVNINAEKIRITPADGVVVRDLVVTRPAKN